MSYQHYSGEGDSTDRMNVHTDATAEHALIRFTTTQTPGGQPATLAALDLDRASAQKLIKQLTEWVSPKPKKVKTR